MKKKSLREEKRKRKKKNYRRLEGPKTEGNGMPRDRGRGSWVMFKGQAEREPGRMKWENFAKRKKVRNNRRSWLYQKLYRIRQNRSVRTTDELQTNQTIWKRKRNETDRPKSKSRENTNRRDTKTKPLTSKFAKVFLAMFKGQAVLHFSFFSFLSVIFSVFSSFLLSEC